MNGFVCCLSCCAQINSVVNSTFFIVTGLPSSHITQDWLNVNWSKNRLGTSSSHWLTDVPHVWRLHAPQTLSVNHSFVHIHDWLDMAGEMQRTSFHQHSTLEFMSESQQNHCQMCNLCCKTSTTWDAKFGGIEATLSISGLLSPMEKMTNWHQGACCLFLDTDHSASGDKWMLESKCCILTHVMANFASLQRRCSKWKFWECDRNGKRVRGCAKLSCIIWDLHKLLSCPCVQGRQDQHSGGDSVGRSHPWGLVPHVNLQRASQFAKAKCCCMMRRFLEQFWHFVSPSHACSQQPLFFCQIAMQRSCKCNSVACNSLLQCPNSHTRIGLVISSFCHSLTGQNGTAHCEFTPQWMLCMWKASERSQVRTSTVEKTQSTVTAMQALCHEARHTETTWHQPNGLRSWCSHRANRTSTVTTTHRTEDSYRQQSKHMVWPTGVTTHTRKIAACSDQSQANAAWNSDQWQSSCAETARFTPQNLARSIRTPCSNGARIQSHHPPTCVT